MRIRRPKVVFATLAILLVSPGSLHAETQLSVTDAAAIAAAEGERVVYGRVKDVVWRNGGRKKPRGSIPTFFERGTKGSGVFS